MNVNDLEKMRENQHVFNDKAINEHWNDYNAVAKENIYYINDYDENHLLDVYSPQLNSAATLPVVVLIHGGGYASGFKELNRRIGRLIASQGFHVVNINYSLMPEVSFKEELSEISAVLDWISDNSTTYGFDSRKVSLMGDSSAGHLVMLAAAAQYNSDIQDYFGITPYEYGLKGVVSVCPATFDAINNSSNEITQQVKNVLSDWLDDDEYVSKSSYQTFLTQDYPEILIVTTPEDSILAQESINIHEFMSQQGVKHRFNSYSPQSNKIDHVFNILFPEYEESKQANQDIIDYLKEMSSR
ncbi:alpha/beta hydrolase [Streptococcus gallolyticus]|uniref:Acetyl esterase/lipase n=1 Tax=Streptococcus gallolyticus TaxID=315405 RepID=A0A1H9LXD8_9STRE|nr:alpha/beta hydrolase [Streptococcus gallolyticus]SER16126.1 Acetyl esterase/lipase [Streptococcus gallolyticus]